MVKKNILPSSTTWDKISKNYNEEISTYDKETANTLIGFLKKLKVNKMDSIIELGCGSGHISALLAKEKYNTSLADFSNEALKKAQKVYEKFKLKGKFINADIMSLDNIPKYDITWNSGVMEHFDNKALLTALKSIHKKTNKYFIFFVPNPKSFIYLYYRFLMIQDKKWDVGYEFLRTNYKKYILKAGFKIHKTGYTGKQYSKNQVEYSFKQDNKIVDQIKYMLENNMFKSNQYYLKYYICKK